MSRQSLESQIAESVSIEISLRDRLSELEASAGVMRTIVGHLNDTIVNDLTSIRTAHTMQVRKTTLLREKLQKLVKMS